MLHSIFMAVWFFLPAGVANMTPILVAKLPGLARWNTPMDFGCTLRGRRILGSHKTWRGLVTGVIAATLTLWLQQVLTIHIHWLGVWTAQVDYAALSVVVLGPLFGIGALGGDALESFLKRQWGIAPGQMWFPWDQTDYIIGGALATAILVRLDTAQYLEILLFWVLAHLAASYVGYRLHLKERPI